MKSIINDSIKRIKKHQKKTLIKSKNNSLIINDQIIPFIKTNYLKHTKLKIKHRLNSTKEIKNVPKKSINSKLNINIITLQSQKENNLQTIKQRSIQKRILSPPKQTKIKIIKKKNQIHQRNNPCSNNLFNVNDANNKLEKETKIINNFSNSTGLSIVTVDKDKEFLKRFVDSEENKNLNFNNYNYNADSQSNKFETILFEEKTSNLNNFRYETISKEDNNDSDDKIILKCDNYSLLTFGNSFSYSNSHKRKTNKKYLNKKNEKNINEIKRINKTIENNYMIKLKEENEILKKELKESTQQISILKNKIKYLKENILLPNKKCIKKPIYRNTSTKVNRTKETYVAKMKNVLMRKDKLNNLDTNHNKKNSKNKSQIIKNRKNDHKKIENLNRKINH